MIELKAKLSLETIKDSKNLANKLSKEDLEAIGNEVVNSYTEDKQSRRKWERKSEDAMKLAIN